MILYPWKTQSNQSQLLDLPNENVVYIYNLKCGGVIWYVSQLLLNYSDV